MIKDDAKGVYGYTRTYEKESALILFNRSDKVQVIDLPANLTAKFTQRWYATNPPFTISYRFGMIALAPRGMMALGTAPK